MGSSEPQPRGCRLRSWTVPSSPIPSCAAGSGPGSPQPPSVLTSRASAPISGQSDWSAGRGSDPSQGHVIPCRGCPALRFSLSLHSFLGLNNPGGSEQSRGSQTLLSGVGVPHPPDPTATLAVAGLLSAFSWITPESWPSLVGVITQSLPPGLSWSSAGRGRPEWAAESPCWAWAWLSHTDQTGDWRPPGASVPRSSTNLGLGFLSLWGHLPVPWAGIPL